MRRLALLLLIAAPAGAQPPAAEPAHRVPFATTGNTLELAVANPSSEAGRTGVTVRLVSAPAWLTVAPESVRLSALAPGAEAVAVFGFEVARQAPVGQPGEVVFDVRGPDGTTWTKAVRLEVEAPRVFALHPAYPNPFNPRTTLAFELPEASRVLLRVFDVLGREIARLVDAEREAGRHEVVWDARQAASGVYVVQAVAETAAGQQRVRTQRLTLLK